MARGSWLVPAVDWEVMFWIGAVPGLVIAYLVSRPPESLRWLIGKGRYAEAEAVLRSMEASTPRRIPAANVAKMTVAKRMNAGTKAGWLELLAPFYRGRTPIVWVLWATAFGVASSLNN